LIYLYQSAVINGASSDETTWISAVWVEFKEMWGGREYESVYAMREMEGVFLKVISRHVVGCTGAQTVDR